MSSIDGERRLRGVWVTRLQCWGAQHWNFSSDPVEWLRASSSDPLGRSAPQRFWFSWSWISLMQMRCGLGPRGSRALCSVCCALRGANVRAPRTSLFRRSCTLVLGGFFFWGHYSGVTGWIQNQSPLRRPDISELSRNTSLMYDSWPNTMCPGAWWNRPVQQQNPVLKLHYEQE